MAEQPAGYERQYESWYGLGEPFLNGKDEWAQLFHEEAIFYYCYLQFYLNNDKKGVADFIGQQQLDVVNNHLFTYLAANLSLNNQQADKAKQVLEARSRAAGYLVNTGMGPGDGIC